MSEAPVVSIKNFSFTYANTHEPILRDLNLEVHAGELILLAGRSGCGKSTLLRCLNGIIPHLLSGTVDGGIMIKGHDSMAMQPETIARYAGSVFQNPRSQFFHTNVLDEIAFGVESSGLPQETIVRRVDAALELFGISHLVDRNMYELSSGEQQKVAFASIHATGPDIFLLDEPSANLDLHAINNLKKLLLVLKNQGKTIIIAEHRLHYLFDIADKLVIMQYGSFERILTNGQSVDDEQRLAYGLRTANLRAFASACDAKRRPPGAAERGGNLHAQEVCYAYKRNKAQALSKFSTIFHEGERVAIIGRNGAGKTTLIKLIAGLLPPSNGVFRDVGGKRLSCAQRLKNSGIVLQECGQQLFYPTVLEELASAAARPGGNKGGRRPADSLKALGLEELTDQHPQNLSAGQQQRLAFAIAAMNTPRILILDEPTSGLDAQSMMAMGAAINKQAAQGTTIIIVTHDIEFIYEFCDRAVVMGKGFVESTLDRRDFTSFFCDKIDDDPWILPPESGGNDFLIVPNWGPGE